MFWHIDYQLIAATRQSLVDCIDKYLGERVKEKNCIKEEKEAM